MTQPGLLGQISGLQAMMADLVSGVPAPEAQTRFHPRLACLSWYLGRAVYRELHWLRQVLAGDADLAARVSGFFAMPPEEAPCDHLPPPDHLLAWAREIQDEHLRRLATPGALPDHPLLAEDRLPWFLLQEAAQDYEAMLWVLHARRLGLAEAQPPAGQALTPLEASSPGADLIEITQGHYRVGSRNQPWAYDHELPPQAVELSSFRIARLPVTNAEFLGFMADGGYERPELWDAEGGAWLAATPVGAPWHWRQDGAGRWYGNGLNGSLPLTAIDPVAGLSRHEARAYAAWVASHGGPLAGAVLQHEYQWEIAARAGHLQGTGRVWEWCQNPFHPYPDFAPWPGGPDASKLAKALGTAVFGGPQAMPEPYTAPLDQGQAKSVNLVGSRAERAFAANRGVLRGASLHTQGCLRRASFRLDAAPGDRFRVSGLRLVFPPP